MLTNAGSGYSTCRGLDVTRWREDATRDAWGQFCLRPRPRAAAASGRPATSRSAGRPTTTRSIFAADKAELPPPRRRRSRPLLEVTVSPEQPAEVRRVTLTNHDDRPRELELTSYAEVVLARTAADLAHPAFGKLFLETEWLAGPEALLCRRRPRSPDQQPVWAVHVAAVGRRRRSAPTEYETDRARFLGRGRTPGRPGGARPGRDALGDDRRRSSTRSSASAGGSGSSRAASAVVAFTTAVADIARGGPGPGRPVPRDRAPSPGPSSWPGPTARSSTGTGAGRPRRPTCSSGWPSHVIFAGSALRADAGRAGREPPGPARPLAATASRATGRSSWPGSPTATSCRWPGSCSPPTPTCGSRGWSSTSSSSTSSRRATSTSCTSSCIELVRAERRARPGRQAGRRLRPQGGADARGRPDPAPGRRPGSSWSATAARSPASSTGSSGSAPCPSPWSPHARPTPDRGDAEPVAPPDLAVRQRPRRLHARRPRILRDRAGRAPARRPPQRQGRPPEPRPGRSCPPAPWINVVANPGVRLPRLRGGLGLHLGRQQPDEPPDPLEQRPGLRPARRGRLPPRRGDRRGLVARRRCPSRRPAPTRRPPRPGLHRLRAADATASTTS